MRKARLFLLILSLILAGIGGPASGEEGESVPVLNDGTPWVDYCLPENLAQLDQKPDSPKDDFYLWVNYDWMKSARIAPGHYTDGPFDSMGGEITNRCLDILCDPTITSQDAVQAQHLYHAYMDWEARDALGVAPLRETIGMIRAVSSIEELTLLQGSPDYHGDSLFRWGIDSGMNDTGSWITRVNSPVLLMEDSAEYRERTEQGDYREAVLMEYIPKILERLGYTPEESSAMMTQALATEAELAAGIMTTAETLSPDHLKRINNEWTRAEAETRCGAFPWLRILDLAGYAGAQRYLNTEPSYFQVLDTIYREERLEDLKSYLTVQTVYTFMPYLDREAWQICTEMRNALYGTEGSVPDMEYACSKVRSYLPVQMARAFLEKNDASKMREDILRICGEILGCYREMLSGEDWLTEETRRMAIEKLDNMRIMAAYPDKWPDYSGLKLEGLGFFDSLTEIQRVKSDICRSLVDQPRDPEFWFFTMDYDAVNDLLMTNAAYNPNSNMIFILRGILGDVFYGENMSEEELYAAIGFVIAHEISHAFDPSGSQYDASGRMNNWWTEADAAAFDLRAKKLIDYYNGITAFSGIHVRGENIQGEAVADLAAVSCMLRLMETKKENVDYRAFFESLARTWRTLISRETEYYNITQDPHPINFIRINSIVQQFPQFHETYGITEGDGMWLAPEDRVLVW